MDCFKCQKGNGLLIRGLCKDCAPALHEKHDLWYEFIGRKSEEFKKITSKDSLEDWYGFEEFLKNNTPLEDQEKLVAIEGQI